MAAVLRLRRMAARLNGCCNDTALNSVVWVMELGAVVGQKSLWAGIGTWYPMVAPSVVSIRTGLL